MHTIIRIDMDNAAFEQPTYEVARILRNLADRVEKHSRFVPRQGLTLRDVNGNVVGYCRVKE
jgi:hypothetical protein